MSEAWKQWEGQIVNSRFVLRQYLGGSPHSAVFLTERQNATFDKAAIKLIAAADSDTKDLHLARWHDVAQLSHPHLLRLFHYGQCKLDGLDLLYTVSEFADEDLAQILPTRPLNPLEAREVLLQIAEALSFLHAANFVHRRVCPSNIFAAGDDIKLSSDSVCRSSGSASDTVTPTAYDPPEVAAAGGSLGWTAAADVYSLAASVVEALTQRLSASGTVPSHLPAPFDEIVDRAQHPDPELRWTAADILNRLNLRPSTAKPVPEFAAHVPVTSVPSLKTANPSSGAGVGTPTAASARATGVQPAPLHVASADKPYEGIPAAGIPAKPKQVTAESLSTYQVPHHLQPDQIPLSPIGPVVAQHPRRPAILVPIIVVAVLLFALLLVPKFLHRSAAPLESAAKAESASAPAAAGEAQPRTSPTGHTARQSAERKQTDAASTSRQPIQGNSTHAGPPAAASSQQPAKDEAPSASSLAAAAANADQSAAEPSPAADRSGSSSSSSSTSADAVAQKFLPDVSQRALNTIHGTVRVGVRVEVAASGSVASADLSNPSGSEFFNKAALQAAKRWQFQRDGSGGTRSWLVQFEFTPSTIRANAAPAS